MTTPGDVTALLRRWKVEGDREAEQKLFSLVYSELRKVAGKALHENPGVEHRIDPRELVSEAYLRLSEYAIETSNRGPFFRLMANAMRHCLIDLLRARGAAKRPQTSLRVADSNVLNSVGASSDVGLIDYYDSLDALKAISPRQAETIELRVVGLGNDEIAQELQISVSTVKRDLEQARAFLAFRLGLSSDWIQP